MMNQELPVEKRLKNERAVINRAKLSNNYYDTTKNDDSKSKKDESSDFSKRRSHSTADSSNKVGVSQGNMTSRLNAISIKPNKKTKIVINLKYTQYDILFTVAREMGYKITKSDKSEYDIIWLDLAPSTNILAKLQKFQRINHFPGMSQVANKANLARNLLRMAKLHQNGYSFFPKTWILPSEYHELKKYAKENLKDTFIVKPEMMSQGKGICLVKNIDLLAKSAP
jgi:hypothetical protein